MADLRGPDGGGYEIDWYNAFARWELDESQAASARTANGTYWVGGTADDIQSIYYLSDSEIGLWVGHYSSDFGQRVATAELVTLAEKLVNALEETGTK